VADVDAVYELFAEPEPEKCELLSGIPLKEVKIKEEPGEEVRIKDDPGEEVRIKDELM
jgi:hypothetical protein